VKLYGLVALISIFISACMVFPDSSKAAGRDGSGYRYDQKAAGALTVNAASHSGLSARAVISRGEDEISVRWKLPQNIKIAGFEVLRKTPGSSPFYQTGIHVKEVSEGVFRFTDKNITGSDRYIYMVEAKPDSGDSYPFFVTEPVAVRAVPVELFQNRPNPFNPSTVISYCVKERTRVILAVFDARGRRIAELLDKERGPGEYSAVWNGFTDSGRMAASGVYFCRLRADGFELTRRMVLLR